MKNSTPLGVEEIQKNVYKISYDFVAALWKNRIIRFKFTDKITPEKVRGYNNKDYKDYSNLFTSIIGGKNEN